MNVNEVYTNTAQKHKRFKIKETGQRPLGTSRPFLQNIPDLSGYPRVVTNGQRRPKLKLTCTGPYIISAILLAQYSSISIEYTPILSNRLWRHVSSAFIIEDQRLVDVNPWSAQFDSNTIYAFYVTCIRSLSHNPFVSLKKTSKKET